MTGLEEKMWNDDINFITMLRKENKELQDKIDKAIELIQDHFIGEEVEQFGEWVYHEHWSYDDIDREDAEELLEILKS